MEKVMTGDEQSAILARLAEPFAVSEIKWRVTHTSRDGKRGAVKPYADPRAYQDRLNKVLTAAGWTKTYDVCALTNITRRKGGDREVISGKVLATCVVTITGIGDHSGSGEGWADEEFAMTGADAQAFKRACSSFGLGRYLYDIEEQWVDLNEQKQPRSVPGLPAWALPKSHASAKPPSATGRAEREPKSSSAVTKGLLDAGVTTAIERHRQELGQALYQSILAMVAQVRSPRDIPSQQLQQRVLHWMESGVRGMAQIREIAAALPDTTFHSILDRHGVQSLAKVPNFGVLKKLVKEITQAAPRRPAA
jgi:hypothetical protein